MRSNGAVRVGAVVLALAAAAGARGADGTMRAEVPSTGGWVATEMKVEAGKCYTLTASGEWRGLDGVATGPEGTAPTGLYDVLGPQPGMNQAAVKTFYLGQHPRHALIGKFAGQDWSFLVGKSVTFLAPASGALQLRMNDADGEGEKRAGKLEVTLAEAMPQWVNPDGTLWIDALVDAADVLHITPEGLWWEYGGSWERVGKFQGTFPTVVNGICWWPQWVDDKKTAVQAMKGVWPGEASQLSIVEQRGLRGKVTPGEKGRKDVALKFQDRGGGPSTVGCVLKVPVAPAAGISVLDKLVGEENVVSTRTTEYLEFKVKENGAGKLTAPTVFRAPLCITAVAQTDSTNLRLFFGERGVLILNWEGNRNELRYHDVADGKENGVPGKGGVAKDQWVTVQWTIEEKFVRVAVDGTERALFKKEYAGAAGRVGIGTNAGATIRVKSLKVGSPEKGSGAAIGQALLKTEEIQELIDAKKYPIALAALGKVLALSGAIAAGYDRHQLMMMKTECLLQERDRYGATTNLATTRMEAKKPEAYQEAVAMALLLERSPKDVYTSKKDQTTYDILDRSKRDGAYAALWADEKKVFEEAVKGALAAKTLPAILACAKRVPAARALSWRATGKTDTVEELAGTMKERAVTMIVDQLKKDVERVNEVEGHANSTITTIFDNGGRVTRKLGLRTGDPKTLGEVETTCSLILDATKELAEAFPGDAVWKEVAGTAVALRQKAVTVRTAQY